MPVLRAYRSGVGNGGISIGGRAMGIDSESDISASLQIGPTTLGMVRIYVEGVGVDLPLDFDPEEADDIAEELRLAAEAARKTRLGSSGGKSAPAARGAKATQGARAERPYRSGQKPDTPQSDRAGARAPRSAGNKPPKRSTQTAPDSQDRRGSRAPHAGAPARSGRTGPAAGSTDHSDERPRKPRSGPHSGPRSITRGAPGPEDRPRGSRPERRPNAPADRGAEGRGPVGSPAPGTRPRKPR